MNPNIRVLLRYAIQLLLPVLFVLGSVHLILLTTRTWIPFEYRRASFPPDTYGFSTADRIYWSGIDLNFLLDDLEISYFDNFTLADGSPMHNERELGHFEDVRVIVDGSRKVFAGAIGISAVLVFLLFRFEGSQVALETLRGGALWALGLLALLAIGSIFAFTLVFTGFHQIFFDPNTWTFRFSDTFIRLYPQRFWQDVILYVIGLTFLESGSLYLITRALMNR